MAGQRKYPTSEVLTFVPPRGSNARTEIRRLRQQYHLSWSALSELMQYSKASVMYYWSNPEKAGVEFWSHFQIAFSKLKQERGDVYEVVALTRLPRRFRVAVRARRCLGHREWCLFSSPDQVYCNDECERLYRAREQKKVVRCKGV